MRLQLDRERTAFAGMETCAFVLGPAPAFGYRIGRNTLAGAGRVAAPRHRGRCRAGALGIGKGG